MTFMIMMTIMTRMITMTIIKIMIVMPMITIMIMMIIKTPLGTVWQSIFKSDIVVNDCSSTSNFDGQIQ